MTKYIIQPKTWMGVNCMRMNYFVLQIYCLYHHDINSMNTDKK